MLSFGSPYIGEDGLCIGDKSLNTISHKDLSGANMRYIFAGCISLSEVPQFDASKVTNMELMFADCQSLITIPKLNTKNVTSMRGMFSGCKLLQTVEEIDLSSVTDVSMMFDGCTNLRVVRFKGDPKNITLYEDMFKDASEDGGTLYYDYRYDYDTMKIHIPGNWNINIYIPQ